VFKSGQKVKIGYLANVGKRFRFRKPVHSGALFAERPLVYAYMCPDTIIVPDYTDERRAYKDHSLVKDLVVFIDAHQLRIWQILQINLYSLFNVKC
jgi:hypothetical protein